MNGTAVHGLLIPGNCTLCLIDHQAPMSLTVRSIDRQSLINNVAGLARVGKLFNLPTIIASIAAVDQNGPNFTQILDVFPSADVIDRQNINCWEEPRFVAVVEASGRRKLVIAALWTEVCLVMPVLSAMADGYEVYVVADASGGTSIKIHENAIQRCVQAGAVPVTWIQVILELPRTWTHAAPTAGVSEITLATAAGTDSTFTTPTRCCIRSRARPRRGRRTVPPQETARPRVTVAAGDNHERGRDHEYLQTVPRGARADEMRSPRTWRWVGWPRSAANGTMTEATQVGNAGTAVHSGRRGSAVYRASRFGTSSARYRGNGQSGEQI